MKKLILALVTAIAFFFAVGSAGALETGTIGFGQCIIQCVISAAVIAIAFKHMEE